MYLSILERIYIWLGYKKGILEIVRKNGMALMYIHPEDQSEQIVTAAIIENAYALKWARQQTEAVCEIAVIQNAATLKFVRDKSERVRGAAAFQRERERACLMRIAQENCLNQLPV